MLKFAIYLILRCEIQDDEFARVLKENRPKAGFSTNSNIISRTKTENRRLQILRLSGGTMKWSDDAFVTNDRREVMNALQQTTCNMAP